jgi:hypothetical protein
MLKASAKPEPNYGAHLQPKFASIQLHSDTVPLADPAGLW